MPFVKVDGSDVFYVCKGTRADLVILMIHGAGGTHRRWWPVMSRMSDRHHIVAVDLPGHGQSAGTTLDSMNAYQNWVSQLIRALNIPRCILVGHSMGGGIALNYAICHPGSLEALVLIGTGARLRVAPSVLESLRQGLVPPELSTQAYGKGAPAELLEAARQEFASVSADVFLNDFTACDNWDALGRLHTVDTPALIVCGENDQMTPLKFSVYLKEHLSQAILVTVPATGHMVILEKPAEVVGLMESFLKGAQ